MDKIVMVTIKILSLEKNIECKMKKYICCYGERKSSVVLKYNCMSLLWMEKVSPTADR